MKNIFSLFSNKRKNYSIEEVVQGNEFNAIVFNEETPQEEINESCPKGGEKLYFNYLTYVFCTKKNNLSKEVLEKYKLLSLFVFDGSLTNAYFVNKNSISVIINFNGSINIKEIEVDNDEDVDDVVDSYFDAKSKTRIEESIEELRLLAKQSNKKELYARIALISIILASAFFYFTKEKPKIIKQAPPKPIVIPLTLKEKAHISRSLSLKLTEMIEAKTEKYSQHPELFELRRNISFGLSEAIDIPPVQPILVNNERWEYPEGPRRGGVRYSIHSTTEQIFPGVGYTFSQQDLYTKEHTVSKVLDETYLVENKSDLDSLVFSEKCLQDTLHLSGALIPFKRDDRSVEISITEINASTTVKEILPLVKSCPILIKEAQQTGNFFRFKLVLYRNKEIQNNKGAY